MNKRRRFKAKRRRTYQRWRERMLQRRKNGPFSLIVSMNQTDTGEFVFVWGEP